MRLARIALAATFAACAAPAAWVAPRDRPAVAPEDDELRIWRALDDAEQDIAESGRLRLDPVLDAYLLEVARKLEPAPTFDANRFRFHVVRDTRPGSFALANGAVYVNTGVLARMESEAELAALLGHEMAHVVHRDAARELRRTGGRTADARDLVRLASVTGYARELEAEADREAVIRMKAAGYDTADAARLFERLRDWAREEGVRVPPSYWSTHPRIEERIESARRLAGAIGDAGGIRAADVYVRRTARVLLENARGELAAGRYRAAWDQLQRYLSVEPGDAVGHYLLAEVARRDATPGWTDAAIGAYRKAIELSPRAAAAWRGLGLVLQKTGQAEEARKAFRRYLELAPGAPDRAHVEAAIGAGR